MFSHALRCFCSELDQAILHLSAVYERAGVTLASLGYAYGPAALTEIDRLAAVTVDVDEGEGLTRFAQTRLGEAGTLLRIISLFDLCTRSKLQCPGIMHLIF